jgi:hypothetical protein
MAERIILTDQPVVATTAFPRLVSVRVLNADGTACAVRTLTRAAESGELVVGLLWPEALSYIEGLLGRELPKPENIPLISIDDWVYVPAQVDGEYRLAILQIRPIM